jgi:hypothetical protein
VGRDVTQTEAKLVQHPGSRLTHAPGWRRHEQRRRDDRQIDKCHDQVGATATDPLDRDEGCGQEWHGGACQLHGDLKHAGARGTALRDCYLNHAGVDRRPERGNAETDEKRATGQEDDRDRVGEDEGAHRCRRNQERNLTGDEHSLRESIGEDADERGRYQQGQPLGKRHESDGAIVASDVERDDCLRSEGEVKTDLEKEAVQPEQSKAGLVKQGEWADPPECHHR